MRECGLRIAIDWKKRGRELLLLTGISLFLAFLRPYGTGAELAFGYVFAFWLTLILIGSAIGEVSVAGFQRIWKNGPAWGVILFASLTTTAAITICLLWLQKITRGQISVGGLPDLFFYVWVISLAMTLIGYTVSRAFYPSAPLGTPEPDDQKGVRTFLERLPVKYRTADLWAIASEDHYCRVFTSLGNELVLLRLSDAERDLASVDGLRVHRSWWVARNGVADIRREDGRPRLILKSGTEVPVSRSYLKAVRDAGLGA